MTATKSAIEAGDGPTLAVPPARLALGAAFVAIYVLWGATFLAIRYAVAEAPPLLTITIRCAGGAAILFAWCAVRRELAIPTAGQWRVAAVAGLLLFLGCHAVLATAEQRVPSGQAALLMTSIPLWLVFLDALIRRRAPSPRVIGGLAVGVAGIFVLTRGGAHGGQMTSSGPVLDHVALLVAGLFWAAGSLVARHGARPVSAVQSTAMQLAAGAVFVGLGSVVLGEFSGWSPASLTPRGAGALAFLVLGGTTLAFAAYTWLLRVTSTAAVGTYAFVNPVIAVGLAWAVGDEPASLHTGLAAALVVTAVILTRSRPASRAAFPALVTGSGVKP
ncbi:MAG TPA: EamA family transporter [Gemmatimonadaceae bacterium]